MSGFVEIDLLYLLILTIIGCVFFGLIFFVIHLITSLFKRELYNIRDNKLLLLIPILSSIISGHFDFSLQNFIKDSLYSMYFDFSLLCIVLLLIYIAIKKKYHLENG